MATKPMKRPIVRDAANKQFTELPDGQFVDVSAIPLDGADSSGAPNLLKHAHDGLAVYASDCIFSEKGNALEVRGGKMYVPDMSATADSLISKDDGNKLKLGSDNGLFVSQTVVSVDADNLVTVGSDGGAKLTPNDVLSNGDVNLLTIDPVDKKIILTKEAIQGNLPVVSQDDGNLVHHGSDKGVYLSLGDILREGDVILHDDGGKVAADISMVYNQPTGVLQLIGYDGVTEVARVIIPSSTSVLKGVELTNGKPDVDGGATEGDYHLTLMFRDQHGAWSDAVGVQVTTTKGSAGTAKYSTKLAEGGTSVSAVRAIFNGSSAIAEGGSSPATVVFGDTSTVSVPFSVSGSVVSGTVSFTPKVGLKSGVYLHFIWALSDGSVVDTYVDVSELVDVYIPGDGITIHGDTISVRPKLDGGVTVGPTGVSVDEEWLAKKVKGQQLAAGDGISLSGTTVSVKPKPSGGVKVDSTGVSVDATWLSQQVEGGLKAGNGISLSGATISVKPKTSGGIAASSDGVSMKVKSASGLTVGTDGLAAVVGDGITFSETGAIIAKLLKNGGLAIKRGTGEIYVDFSLLPADMLQEIVRAMVQEGGGLAVDGNGQLYVDFSTMPTDKFEAMLKSIRVPIWLTKPLTIYVAPTGSDTLDDGRGLTPDKPFASIQAAVNYVSTTYNLYKYNATISVAPGNYGREHILLPSYTTSTGKLIIKGSGAARTDVVCGRFALTYASVYEVHNLTIYQKDVTAGAVGSVDAAAGQIDLYNVQINLSEIQQGSGQLWGVFVHDSGVVRVWSTASQDTPNGLVLNVAGASPYGIIMCNNGGAFNFAADVTVTGGGSWQDAAVRAQNVSIIASTLSAAANPGRRPTVIIDGVFTGKRYAVALNGIIGVAGAGPDFWPGDTEGNVSSGGQYA